MSVEKQSAEKGFDPRPILKHCQSDLAAMLRCLRQAVEIESPSGSKADVDRMARFFAEEFKRLGGSVRLLPHPSAGAAVVAEFWGEKRGRAPRQRPILLLGHHDTVWNRGTLAGMPFRIRGGRAYGPGSLDMKSGIVCALRAIDALQALGLAPASPVRVFLNPDEEVSSRAFRRELLAEAGRARAVLVLEPAQGPNGALKTARKGVGEFEITALGRAAHAGINPAAGVNAITELARQILRIEKLARPERGLTLNAGVIEGGTRSNVVPERATVRIDVRIARARDRETIERQVYGLKPIYPGARLEIRGGVNRPPMERAVAADLFRKAHALGRQLGMELEEASTGGGSDGNFTAALGVPTLDGLGGVGDGAHARHEHVIIRELPRRAALLSALLATL
ncbi:MAG TPA: M20 family metallopeptidase [Terriglobia bacterium]|nr:M20 family metallopeptidase [Terriglobia bacterium]